MGDPELTRTAARWAARQGRRSRRNRCRRQSEEPRFRETAPKKTVLTLVERDGRARSFHVANVTAKTLRPFVMKNVSRKSTLMTDEASYYVKMGREFADHNAVDHSRTEYAYKLDGRTVSTINAENYFSIFKRGVTAPTIQSARRTCTAISPSSISATTTAQSLASRMPSAPPRRLGRRRQAIDLSSASSIRRPLSPNGNRQRSRDRWSAAIGVSDGRRTKLEIAPMPDYVKKLAAMRRDEGRQKNVQKAIADIERVAQGLEPNPNLTRSLAIVLLEVLKELSRARADAEYARTGISSALASFGK